RHRLARVQQDIGQDLSQLSWITVHQEFPRAEFVFKRNVEMLKMRLKQNQRGPDLPRPVKLDELNVLGPSQAKHSRDRSVDAVDLFNHLPEKVKFLSPIAC